MPKYFPFKVAGYYLYYTMECVIECMHVHASDKRLTEKYVSISNLIMRLCLKFGHKILCMVIMEKIDREQ